MRTYGMYLYNSGPAGQHALVVVHRVAQRLPVVLGLVLVHLADVLVGLAGDGDGVRQVEAL